MHVYNEMSVITFTWLCNYKLNRTVGHGTISVMGQCYCSSQRFQLCLFTLDLIHSHFILNNPFGTKRPPLDRVHVLSSPSPRAVMSLRLHSSA